MTNKINGTGIRDEKATVRFPDAGGRFLEIRVSSTGTLELPEDLPAEVSESLKSLHKAAFGLHEKAHSNGLRKDRELRSKSAGLKRPRFHDTTQVFEDPLKERGAEARRVSWILTNTVALQTYPKVPKNVEVVLPAITLFK